MKRDFGKKLIEEFFYVEVDLTHVIDTSGAFIPGHATPTVSLVGRNRTALKDATSRAVLGVRGEPAQPEEAANGLVWTAIVAQTDRPGSESDWIIAPYQGDFAQARHAFRGATPRTPRCGDLAPMALSRRGVAASSLPGEFARARDASRGGDRGRRSAGGVVLVTRPS